MEKTSLQVFYNHARIMQDARRGTEIVNSTPQGNEVQLYNVGDVVRSTEHSTYRFARGVIIEVYTANCFCYYVCDLNGCTYTARTKDIRRV